MRKQTVVGQFDYALEILQRKSDLPVLVFSLQTYGNPTSQIESATLAKVFEQFLLLLWLYVRLHQLNKPVIRILLVGAASAQSAICRLETACADRY